MIHHLHSAREADALAKDLPCSRTVACDLADPEAIGRMVRDLAEGLEDWRVLVNSASLFEPDDVSRLDPATYDRAMTVNALAPALLSQAFLTEARAMGGRRVIQITDQKLANPNPDFFSYTMSKHALAATVPMLAMGAAQPADRVYALAPGAILASHDQSEAETDVSHRLNLLNRKTEKEEIASAALFLAEGWLASGQTLFVDSGQHLMSQPRDVIYLAREEAGA